MLKKQEIQAVAQVDEVQVDKNTQSKEVQPEEVQPEEVQMKEAQMKEAQVKEIIKAPSTFSYYKMQQLIQERLQLNTEMLYGWCVADIGNSHDACGFFDINGQFKALPYGRKGAVMDSICAIVNADPPTKEEPGLWRNPKIEMGPSAEVRLLERFKIKETLDTNGNLYSRKNIFRESKTWAAYTKRGEIEAHNNNNLNHVELSFHTCKTGDHKGKKMPCIEFKPMFTREGDKDNKFHSKTNSTRKCKVLLFDVLVERFKYMKEKLYKVMKKINRSLKPTEMKVLLTHPANSLNSGYIALLKDSALKAGFKEIKTVDEPYATAVNCMQQKLKDGEEITVCISDSGAGTFDQGLYKMTMDKLTPLVKGVVGGTIEVIGCGGIEINKAMIVWLTKKIGGSNKRDSLKAFGDNIDQMYVEIERVKRAFGDDSESIQQFIIVKTADEKEHKVKMTKEDLKKLLKPFATSINTSMKNIIMSAKENHKIEKVDEHIISGGGSKLQPLYELVDKIAEDRITDGGDMNVIEGAGKYLKVVLMREYCEAKVEKAKVTTIEVLDSGVVGEIAENKKKRKIGGDDGLVVDDVIDPKKKKTDNGDDIKMNELENKKSKLDEKLINGFKQTPMNVNVSQSAVKLVVHASHIESNRYWADVFDEYRKIGDTVLLKDTFTFDVRKDKFGVELPYEKQPLLTFRFYEGHKDVGKYVVIADVDLEYPFKPYSVIRKINAYTKQFEFNISCTMINKSSAKLTFHCGSKSSKIIKECLIDFSHSVELDDSDINLDPLNPEHDHKISLCIDKEYKKQGWKKPIFTTIQKQ